MKDPEHVSTPIPVPVEDSSFFCDTPCIEVTVQFDAKTLVLVSIDLLDKLRAWVSLPVGMLSANGKAAAFAALRASIRASKFTTPCLPGCECDLGPAPPFSKWTPTAVIGAFSIPAPAGNAKLQYRVHGRASVRVRVNVGICSPVIIDA